MQKRKNNPAKTKKSKVDSHPKNKTAKSKTLKKKKKKKKDLTSNIDDHT